MSFWVSILTRYTDYVPLIFLNSEFPSTRWRFPFVPDRFLQSLPGFQKNPTEKRATNLVSKKIPLKKEQPTWLRFFFFKKFGNQSQKILVSIVLNNVFVIDFEPYKVEILWKFPGFQLSPGS